MSPPMNSNRQNAAHADKIVLKRLKFVVRNLAVLARTPSSAGRQAHVYIFEVVDAIGDWSGNPDQEILEFLNKKVFPLICRIIASMSQQEFDNFQSYSCRYLLMKWPETENFNVLDFLADLYAFIARIAPAAVASELVEVFQQEEMPPHVTLVIVPSLLRNTPESVPCNYLDKGTRGFLLLDSKSPRYIKAATKFWETLPSKFDKFKSVKQMTSVLRQCSVTSAYLHQLEENTINEIIRSWNDQNPSPARSEGFLLAGVLFLHAVCLSTDKPLPESVQQSTQSLMQLILILTETCTNRQIRAFATKVIQRVLEYSAETESLKEFIQILKADDDDPSFSECASDNILLNTIDSSIEQLASEVTTINEPTRERILSMIDSLQKLLDNSG